MSDYTKGQIFANLKDSDADPTVFDTEFSSVATVSATKADKTGTTFTGAIVVPAGATGAQALQAQEVLKFSFPTGTKMAFFQATAPTGWTQDVTNNDALLRVVSSGGGGIGGVDGASTSTGLTGAHQLTITEMPAHTHTGFVASATSPLAGSPPSQPIVNVSGSTSSTGGNGTHTHTAWRPKYIDMIVCSKN